MLFLYLSTQISRSLGELAAVYSEIMKPFLITELFRYDVACNDGVTMRSNASGNSTSERARKHRIALRAAGLRPLQIWVPDTRRSGFAEECRRQSLALRGDAHERKILKRLEVAADTDGWK